jgi:GNAT superfamily N-acetyltransferase
MSPASVSSELRLRRATAADAAAIGAVDRRSRQWGYQGILPAPGLEALTREERAVAWAPALEVAGPVRVWLAEADGCGLGFAAWEPERSPEAGRVPARGAPAASGPALEAAAAARPAELLALYVVPEAAGTGLAGRLLAAVWGEMTAEGFTGATLWVLEANARARRFYERTGWRADGACRLIHRCGAEVASVRYTRALPP